MLLIIFTAIKKAVVIQAEMPGKDYFYMVQDCTDCLICFCISCTVLRLAQRSTIFVIRTTQTFWYRSAFKELVSIC